MGVLALVRLHRLNLGELVGLELCLVNRVFFVMLQRNVVNAYLFYLTRPKLVMILERRQIALDEHFASNRVHGIVLSVGNRLGCSVNTIVDVLSHCKPRSRNYLFC